MKVQYTRRRGFSGVRLPETADLASFLEPVSTGSDQGHIEQVQAEVAVLKSSVGTLLAIMVERGFMTFEEACDAAGMHKWYRDYNFPDLKLIT